MNLLPCVITGCTLTEDDRHISGDLFDGGLFWIFNGNYDWRSRQPQWMDDPHEARSCITGSRT